MSLSTSPWNPILFILGFFPVLLSSKAYLNSLEVYSPKTRTTTTTLKKERFFSFKKLLKKNFFCVSKSLNNFFQFFSSVNCQKHKSFLDLLRLSRKFGGELLKGEKFAYFSCLCLFERGSVLVVKWRVRYLLCKRLMYFSMFQQGF